MCPDNLERVWESTISSPKFVNTAYEDTWTMLMQKILQNHLLCAFVAKLKIGAIYALYPESFCDKNLAFCDSDA